MNKKPIILSVTALLVAASVTSAQSLLDLPGLLGRQQQDRRVQENAVKVEYDIDFQYFFDLRSFGASEELFMATETFNVARFSPSAVLRFDQDARTTHRLALGIDLTKNLGANPTAVEVYSEAEHQSKLSNFDLMKDIFFYYNYKKSIGDGILDFYAGILPRTILDGDYTRAIFADDIRYYDPNLEGVTFKYSAPRFKAEVTADIAGVRGVDRVGCEMVFTSGIYNPVDWASLGWSAAYTHSNGSLLASADVDFALVNPYAKVDFGSKLGMQELSVKAGPIATYQLDYKMPAYDESGEEVGESPHFPMGAEVIFNVRHWGFGLENTYYFGDNLNTYMSSAYSGSSAATYAGTIYKGEDFYFTRRSVPAWYDRLELYWQPLKSEFVGARFSAIGHFITPAGRGTEDQIGPFIGSQVKATVLFNLDAFRHPRKSGSSSGSRRSGSTQRSEPAGPILSL